MEQTNPNPPKLDKEKGEKMEEGSKRRLIKPLAFIVSLLAIGLSLFEVDAARTMSYSPQVHRSIFLMLVLVLIFFIYPARKNSPKNRISWVDGSLILLSIVTGLYIVLQYREFADRAGALAISMSSLGLLRCSLCSNRCEGPWATFY